MTRIDRRAFAAGLLTLPTTLSLTGKAIANSTRRRAEWMTGRWGIMLHWIAPGPGAKSGRRRTELNDAVDHFDLDRLIGQISGTDISWVIFTVGQNSGLYASPNHYLDSIAGPGRTPSRDLVLELAKALSSKNIALIAYAPGEIKAVKALHSAFGWDPANQDTFQQRYTQFLREYSDRYGEYCAGWWIDGCYNWKDFPNSKRDWPLWSAALRSGNPKRALSFNDGCFRIDHPYALADSQDFLSGEADGFSLDGPVTRSRGNAKSFSLTESYLAQLTCQPHVVAPIDNLGKWGFRGPGEIGPPLYRADELAAIIRRYRELGVAATFNVGIYQEGFLGDQTAELLQQLS